MNYAHSDPRGSHTEADWEPRARHLREVAERAKEQARGAAPADPVLAEVGWRFR